VIEGDTQLENISPHQLVKALLCFKTFSDL
jgi:hypothetical protein